MHLNRLIKKYLFSKNTPSLSVGTKNEATRIQWLESTLKKIPAGSTILDAGAGEQQFKKFCSHLNYLSQDFAQYKPDNLKTGLQMDKWNYGELDIISDIAAIPRGNETLDAIMCTEVFEHIVNPREAIKEFSRLLRKDGYLIVTAPFCSLTHFAPYHFYSGFNTFFYETELEKKGFQIVEITPNGNYFEYLAQEINRLPYMAEHYGSLNINKTDLYNINQIKALLQKLSNNDTTSSELLCFGYQVLAKKK